MNTVPTALSIAGSDPSGGAGIQADLKTFLDHGVYGMAVLAALTAQSTRGVTGVHPVPPDFIELQLRTLFADIRPDAIKIGMLGTAAAAAAVARGLEAYTGPVVLDPVMVATSGDALLEPEAENALVELLVPRATLITPNLPEAERLGIAADPAAWARRRGIAVLLKGGHGSGDAVEDCLFLPDGAVHGTRHPRVPTRNTHGTGCTLSSAVAAGLARGEPLVEATGEAIAYVAALLDHGKAVRLGQGSGPLLHGRLLDRR